MAVKTKPRHNYTDSFKADVVRRVLKDGELQSEIAEELDVSESSISNWIKEARNSKPETPHVPAPSPQPQTVSVVSGEVRDVPATRPQTNGTANGTGKHDEDRFRQLCQQVEILRELVISKDKFIDDVLSKHLGISLKR